MYVIIFCFFATRGGGSMQIDARTQAVKNQEVPDFLFQQDLAQIKPSCYQTGIAISTCRSALDLVHPLISYMLLLQLH